MSDLQIGLAMLGALIVAAVLVFNWLQERQFRRRAEDAFASRHDDILLDRPAAATIPAVPASSARATGESRIEPRIEPQFEAVPEPALPTVPGSRLESTLPQPKIDYIAEIRAGELVEPEHLVWLQQSLAGLRRKITFSGFDFQSKSWEPLVPGLERYTAVRAAIQLVDRSGAINSELLQTFGDAVRAAANRMAAIAELPEFAAALGQALELDEFCADVDVVVGINVIARTGQIFHGTKIRALAEASGFQLQPSGVFQLQDDQGGALFSLDNQEPEPFLIERIRGLTTPGITFLLDVPRVGNGLRAFDRMVAVSRSFADSLDGMLADDNRALLNDAGLDKIRNQLRAIYAAMESRGIQAGSALALRLFS